MKRAGFVQMPGAPDTFKDEAYTGMSEGGVLGMLETIESDFARLIAETTAAEQEAAADFKKFVADSSKDKAIKGTDPPRGLQILMCRLKVRLRARFLALLAVDV